MLMDEDMSFTNHIAGSVTCFSIVLILVDPGTMIRQTVSSISCRHFSLILRIPFSIMS